MLQCDWLQEAIACTTLVGAQDITEARPIPPENIIDDNPYGCFATVQWPHGSLGDPGDGYINAKSYIACPLSPPAHAETITTTLYQKQSSGWFKIKKVSEGLCPGNIAVAPSSIKCLPHQTGNDHKNYLMRHILTWKCEEGTTHTYKSVSLFEMRIGDVKYVARFGAQKPDVECRRRS